MLTGLRPFAGTEVSDVLAAVLRDEPDWKRLPADTPPSIHRLLRRSLKKDRSQRLASISDAGIELADAVEELARGERPSGRTVRAGRRTGLWATAAIVAALAVAAVGMGWRSRPAPTVDLRITRFDIVPPEGASIEWAQPMSPDGSTVAFIARLGGRQVWLRPLNSATARPLPGTEGATRAFWSPDSRHVAFFTNGDLKEVGVDGSGPRLIARGPFRDGAWSADGTVLVGGQLGQPLMRVSERGGTLTAETALNASEAEVSHDYPEFLPDGRHYIYLARRGVNRDSFATYVGTLGSTERKLLPGILSAAKYSASGHLLFLRGDTLLAQAFSLDRLEVSGDPFPLAEQVGGTRVATYSVSKNGTLAFIGGFSFESDLAWFDRKGTRLSTAGPRAIYGNPTVAPNGRVVAFDRGLPPDVWLLDLDRQAINRVTSERSADRQPIWSPDGQRLAFVSNRTGSEALYERAVAGGQDRQVTPLNGPIELHDWSRDGRYLAYAANGDIWALPLATPREPIQVTRSPLFQDINAAFAPDGRWIAYQSDESKGVTRSGEGDIFVQSFPERGGPKQVSTAGGFTPRWSADGKELFYVTPEGILTAVSITARGDDIEIGTPTPLFSARLDGLAVARPVYRVAADGRLLLRLAAATPVITVIVNWHEELKQRVPVR